jgi:putative phosphoesterase
MQIAVLSDTHSRYHTVEKVLEILAGRKVTHVIHCGDIEDAETVWLFKGLTAHFVFGNCDTDRLSLQQAIEGIGETCHGDWGQVEWEGVKIAFVHGDDGRLKRDLEASGHFDFLFYGHTHVAARHQVGSTQVINPGALHRARPRSFLLLDLPSGKFERVEVE